MIYLGTDHGGFDLKEKIKKFLDELGYQYNDLGNTKLDSEDDYPDYSLPVAEHVSNEDDPLKPWDNRPKGILFCRSAGGVIIAANKVKGVRAVHAFDVKSAIHCREDNDCNIIAISGDWTSLEDAKKIIKTWLETEFTKAKRHVRRLNKIKEYENSS